MDIKITLPGDEAQYILDAIDTHVKTHGLKVATRGVVILQKLQGAAAASQEGQEDEPAG